MDEADRRIESDRLITVIALAVTAFVFLPAFINRDIIFALNDDVMIRDILNGSYSGEPSAMTVYMRVPLSFVLATLYRILPAVPWFGAFQCGCFITSFFLILDRIFTITAERYSDNADKKSRVRMIVRMAVYSILCAVIFYCVFYPRFVLIHYTVTAAVTGGTGLFLLFSAGGSKKDAAIMRNSAIMLILCDQIRSQVFMMILPFILVAVIFLIINRRKKMIRWFVITAAVYAVLLGIHTICYLEPDWKAYLDYNDARTELYDYALIWDTDEGRAYYRQIGVDDVEYPVLRNYDIALDDGADSALFRKMAAYAADTNTKSTSVKLKETVWMIRHNMFSKGTERSYALLLSGYILLVIAAMIMRKFTVLIPTVLSAGIHFGLYGLLLWRGRFPERVMISLYFTEYLIIAGLFAFLLLSGKSGKDEKIWCGTIVLCAIMSVELIFLFKTADIRKGFNRTYDRQLSVNSDCNMLYLYLATEAESGTCFMTDVYALVDATGYALTEKLPERGGTSMPGFFSLGGWISGSPLMEKRLLSFGEKGESPVKYICRENTGLSPEDFGRYSGFYLTEEKRIETGYGTFVIYDGE